MGVLTTFYRVDRGMFERILAEPEIVDEIEDGEGEAPPSANIDKMWHETTLLLKAAGHVDAAGVFEDATELETDSGVEVQALSVDAVGELAPMLASIALDGIVKAAIDSEDFDGFREKPWEAESAAKALGVVVDFVRAAAAAREAIVIATS